MIAVIEWCFGVSVMTFALEGLALHVVDAAGDHDVGFTQRNLAA